MNPKENNRMKILLFCKFSILFILVLLPHIALSPKITSDGGCRIRRHRRVSVKVKYIRHREYSPDGARLAVAGYIGVWIYDAYTGAEDRSIH